MRAKPKIEKICLFCGIKFYVIPCRSDKAKTCSVSCRQIYISRSTAAKRGNTQRGRGDGKTYTKLNGRHMHVVIAERKIGRALVKGEIVHHIDGNKKNNHPDNLEIMSQSNHVRSHIKMMLQRRKEIAGY